MASNNERFTSALKAPSHKRTSNAEKSSALLQLDKITPSIIRGAYMIKENKDRGQKRRKRLRRGRDGQRQMVTHSNTKNEDRQILNGRINGQRSGVNDRRHRLDSPDTRRKDGASQRQYGRLSD